MSKGVIVNHIGDGQYTVEVERQTQPIEIRKLILEEDKTRIETGPLPAAEAELNESELTLSQAAQELDSSIASMNNCISINGTLEGCQAEQNQVTSKVSARLQAATAVGIAKAKISDYKAAILDLDKKLNLLNNAPAKNEEITAWVSNAAYAPAGEPTDSGQYRGTTTILSTGQVVGLADVYTASGLKTVILPAADSPIDNKWLESRDGLEMPVLGMTPEQAAHSATLFAPAEVWEPLFREATVDAVIDDDLVNITLSNYVDQPFTDNGSDISINEQIGSTLSNVSVDYLLAICPPVEVGDTVLVWFQNRNINSPLVIGFITNPKPVEYFDLTYTADTGLHVSGDPDQEIEKGGNGSSVTAIEDTEYFSYWTGTPPIFSPTITDTDIRGNFSRVAKAVPPMPTQLRMRISPNPHGGGSGGGVHGHSQTPPAGWDSEIALDSGIGTNHQGVWLQVGTANLSFWLDKYQYNGFANYDSTIHSVPFGFTRSGGSIHWGPLGTEYLSDVGYADGEGLPVDDPFVPGQITPHSQGFDYQYISTHEAIYYESTVTVSAVLEETGNGSWNTVHLVGSGSVRRKTISTLAEICAIVGINIGGQTTINSLDGNHGGIYDITADLDAIYLTLVSEF